MRLFEGVIRIVLSSINRFVPVEQSLRSTSPSQLCSEVKETSILHFPGAILTISQTDMFGPSILCTTVGKCEEGSFSSLSLNLFLSSISS